MRSENQAKDDSENPNEFDEEDPLKQIKGEQGRKKQKRSFRENVTHVLKNVTVEPAIMVFVISYVLTTITSVNFYLEKACLVNLNISKDICTSLKLRETEGLKEYEILVQKLTASAMSWRSSMIASIPTFLILLVGSWLDSTGRKKMFIIIPICGQILACCSNMMNVFYFYELRLEVLVFSEAIIEACSGSICVILLAAFSLVAAITKNENRTFRMGIASFCLTVGFPIGMGLSGIMVKKLGYYGSYGVSASIQCINLIYNILVLRDPEKTSDQIVNNNKGTLHKLRLFFNFSNITEALRVGFTNGPVIILLLGVTCILFGTLHGELSTVYLLTRYRYNWDEVKFSIYQSYNFVTHTIGTIFSITVFSKYLQWHDSMLGIISTGSKIMSSFINFFAVSETIFYIAPLVDILNGTSILASRSILSKQVPPNEFGKLNSIFTLAENVMPLLFVPMYTRIYTATMVVLPGSMFLVATTLMIPSCGVFVWLFCKHRKEVKKLKIEENGKNDKPLQL